MTPIVLQHGLGGFGRLKVGPLQLSYFGRIERAIVAAGHPLIVSGVHPTAGIERRARQLKENILRQSRTLGLGDQRLVILAHSLGGLDARFMITHLGMAQRVAALVTVCTPHHGSPYADWCATHLGKRLGGFALANFLGIDIGSLLDLTTRNCAAFNEQVPDAAGVRYFSISAARPAHRVPLFALHAYNVVRAAEGENDSLVSVRSAQWGEHLATWPADHWHTINRRYLLELQGPTGDIAPYWASALRQVLNELNSGGR